MDNKKAIPLADMFSDLKTEISIYENSEQSVDEMIQGIKSIISIYERWSMKKYKVWVRLEAEYDDIEAENEEEAFVIASDFAMESGNWSKEVELLSESEEV